MKKTLLVIGLASALISGCASTTLLTDSQVMQQFPQLQKANTLLNDANKSNLALYSPEQMKQALAAYELAYAQAIKGNSAANAPATKAISALTQASKQAQEANYVFEEVFIARQKALQVNANALAKDDFNKVENQFKKMLSLLEEGNDSRAKRDISEVKNQYLALELAALKSNMLNIAEEALKDAYKDDLEDNTPILIAQAKDEYRLALDTLEADRLNTAKANIHSNKAISIIKRARAIADIQQYFDNADYTEEQKILWYQEQLSTVLSPLIKDIAFDEPNKDIINSARNYLAQELVKLENQSMVIASLRNELDGTKRQSTQRENELTRDKNEALLAAQLELEKQQKAKQEDDARFEGVQKLFNEDEATVYRQLNNVLIRAQGFAFKPGSSEIESSNFALLNKIIAAVNRFPNAKILVSGHTDATGSAELNLELSQARAQTVTAFMNQVGNVPTSRLQSNGFGKEKPVASNETAEGRAKNRRVEILIIN